MNNDFTDTSIKRVTFPAIEWYRFFPKVAVNNSFVEYVKVMDGARYQIKGDNYNTYNAIGSLYIPEKTLGFDNYAFRNIHIDKFFMNIKNPLPLSFSYGADINACDNIYVPIGSSDLYKAATNWSSYKKEYKEYDFDEDILGIRPHMDYTKDIQGLQAKVIDYRIGAVLTPRNAVRDIIYNPSEDILEIDKEGNILAKKSGTCDVEVVCSYNQSVKDTVRITIPPLADSFVYNKPETYDTGIHLTLNTRMYMKFVNGNMSVQMGTTGGSWNSVDSMYFNSMDKSTIRFMNNGQTSVKVGGGEILEVMFENGKVTVNGVEYTTGIRTGNTGKPIRLFNNGFNMNEPNFIGTFYEARVYEGNDMIARYIPAEDGKIIRASLMS